MYRDIDKSSKYLKLFSSCVPVNGNQRSIICDLQNGKYYFIPNALYEIITIYKEVKVIDLFNMFENSDKKTISEYFKLLFDNNLAFLTDEPFLFPDIEENFHHPSVISNAIIDIGQNTKLEFVEKFISELTSLGCRALEIRIFNNIKNQNVEFILGKTLNTSLRSIEILMPDDVEKNISWTKKIFHKHKRLSTIVFHSSNTNSQIYNEEKLTLVLNIKQKIDSAKCCGTVDKSQFSINIPHFTESISHNSCLNRKVSLDEFGNIKNCPSSIKNYGHISNVFVFDVVMNNKFREMWEINKNQIDVCKDCEFRNICTDCRIFISDEKNLYSKPLKCKYNPYTTQWED